MDIINIIIVRDGANIIKELKTLEGIFHTSLKAIGSSNDLFILLLNVFY